MSKHTIEFNEKCKSCNGTGVYIGIGEMDGAGVVCYTCKGTGCHHVKIEYEDFEKRQKRNDVERVFETNPGIIIGKGKRNKYKLSDFGGIPYIDWWKNSDFSPKSENRQFTCPGWWYQSTDYTKKPKWEWCPITGSFSNCSHFENKEKCWKRWDKENP